MHKDYVSALCGPKGADKNTVSFIFTFKSIKIWNFILVFFRLFYPDEWKYLVAGVSHYLDDLKLTT